MKNHLVLIVFVVLILAAFLVAVAKGGKKPEDAPTGSEAVSVTEQSTEDA